MERLDATKLAQLPEDVAFDILARMTVSDLEAIGLSSKSHKNLVIKYLSDPSRLLMRLQASGPDETLALMVTFFHSPEKSACFRKIAELAADENVNKETKLVRYALKALTTNDIKKLDVGTLSAAIEYFENLQDAEAKKITKTEKPVESEKTSETEKSAEAEESIEAEVNPGRKQIILSLKFIHDLIQYTQPFQLKEKRVGGWESPWGSHFPVPTFSLLKKYFPGTSMERRSSPKNFPDFYLNFSGVDLSNFDLCGAYFSYARLQDVKFLNSVLCTTQFYKSHFNNVKIELLPWTESLQRDFPLITNNFGNIWWFHGLYGPSLEFTDESDFKDFIKKLDERLTMLQTSVVVAPDQMNEFARSVMSRVSGLLLHLYNIPNFARTHYDKPEDAALFWKIVDLDLLEKTICEHPMYRLAFPNQFDNLLSGTRRFLASNIAFFGNMDAVKKAEEHDPNPMKQIIALRKEKEEFMASPKPPEVKQ